jgi:prophage antirepressor-like protein
MSLSKPVIVDSSSSSSVALSRDFMFKGVKLMVLGTVDKPYFVGRQVADILGYKNASDALQKLVKPSWKIKFSDLADKQALVSSFCVTRKLHIQAHMDLISEPGLYALVLKSKLPSAMEFADWVVEEFIPTIRKTGSYSSLTALPLVETKSSLITTITTHVKDFEDLIDHNKFTGRNEPGLYRLIFKSKKDLEASKISLCVRTISKLILDLFQLHWLE